jgi:hypothetical protein
MVRDPDIMHDDYLESGETLESFFEGFPTLSRDNVVWAIAAPVRRL